MQKEVKFFSDGLVLRGTLFIPEKENFGGVIFYHGSGSRRNNYLPIGEELAELGVASLAFDFRGCGKSDGVFESSTITDSVTDGQAALDFLLLQKGLKKDSIGLVGVSRGGHVASVIAGNNPKNIVSVILRAPVAYPKDLVDLPKGKRVGDNWLKDKSRWATSPALTGIEKFKHFLLIVVSEKDEIIPKEMIDEYKVHSGAQFTDVQIIKGATHNIGKPDSIYRQEFKDLVVTWFTRKG